MVTRKTIVNEVNFDPNAVPSPGHTPSKVVTITPANDISFDATGIIANATAKAAEIAAEIAATPFTVVNRLAFLAAHPEVPDAADRWKAYWVPRMGLVGFNYDTASAQKLANAEAAGLIEVGSATYDESYEDSATALDIDLDQEDEDLDALVLPVVPDTTPRPDYTERCKTQVRPFLATVLGLSGSEAIRVPLNFQAYGRTFKSLRGTFSTPDNARMALEELNIAGGNIGVQVNVPDDSGSHAADHLTAISTIWLDYDGHLVDSPLAIEDLLPLLPISPTAVVRTGSTRSYHIYWMLDTPETFPTEAGPRKQFMNVVKGMLLKAASVVPGGDPQAATPERPMRMPGFKNTKPGSGWAELVMSDGPRYTFGQLLSTFPPMPVQDTVAGDFTNETTNDRRARLLAKHYLLNVADETPQRGSGLHANGTLMGVIRNLCAGHALPEETATAMLYRYYLPDRSQAVFRDSEVAKKIADAYRSPANWAWKLPKDLRLTICPDRVAAELEAAAAKSKAQAEENAEIDARLGVEFEPGGNIAPDAPSHPVQRVPEMDEDMPDAPYVAPEPIRRPLAQPRVTEIELPVEDKPSTPEFKSADETHIAYYFSKSRWAARVRYCAETDVWWAWNGKVWAPDKLLADDQLTRFLAQEFLNPEFEGNALGLTTPAQVAKINSARGHSGILTCARSRMRVRMSEFDADDYKINTKSGVLDLKDFDEATQTFRLIPHNRQMFTKCLNVTYDPAAACPRFNQFMTEISCGDSGISLILQQIFGLSLTGDVREQRLPFFTGTGSNGKGMICQTMSRIMADYYVSSSPSLVMESRSEHPTILAALEGIRLTVVAEVDVKKHLDVAKVKLLTGGDPIALRGMYQDFRTVEPHFKLVICANGLPPSEDYSDGFWRRFLPVPFNAQFLREDADTALSGKLMAESSGIFNWVLRGLRSYQLNGLVVPQASMDEHANHRKGQDHIKDFLEDVLVRDQYSAIRSGEMHLAFAKWSTAHKVRPLTREVLGKELVKHGIPSAHTRNGSEFRGWAFTPAFLNVQMSRPTYETLGGPMDDIDDDCPKVVNFQSKSNPCKKD